MEAGRRALSTAAANVTLLGGGRRWIRGPGDHVDRSRMPVETVTDAAHGHDLEWRTPRELLAQPADVHVDRLALARELAAPHVLEQRVARSEEHTSELQSRS